MDEVTALTQAAPERAIDTDPTEYSARTLGDGESTTSPVPADAATIGRFAVLRKLGEGGMGTVFAAYDERLDRKIAVKVLHSVDARARMLREAQALAKLSHPNVVQVYEIGEDHGLVFIAMEFVNGTTLKGWCEGRARAWVELLDVFVQAGHGLHAAHVRGLVHRDFKPENVLIGVDGRARVADFGLAARRDHGLSAADSLHAGARPALAEMEGDLTRTGGMVGTPAYMSPEQLRDTEVGAASDQFSFCVALYMCLFGQHPFPGEGMVDRATNVLSGVLRPPPARADVPPSLTAAILRGLAVDPDRRWPSMAALVDELERHQPGDPRAELAIGQSARLLAVLSIVSLAAGLDFFLISSQGPSDTIPTDRAFYVSLVFMAGSAALVASLRRRLPTTSANRKVVLLVLISAVAIALHRGLCTLMGVTLAPVLLGDLMILSSLFVAMSVLLSPRFMLYGGLTGAAAILAAIFPPYAALMVSASLGAMIIVTIVLRRRSRDPTQAVLDATRSRVSASGSLDFGEP